MNRYIVRALALACILVAGPALAQAVVTAPNPLGDIWLRLEPTILDAAATIITLLIGLAVAKARQKWHIDIEAKWQADLHQAAMTGVQLGLDKVGVGLNGVDPQSKVAVIAAATDHMISSVPGAIKGLKAGSDMLVSIAASKLAALTNASATVGVTTTTPATGG